MATVLKVCVSSVHSLYGTRLMAPDNHMTVLTSSSFVNHSVKSILIASQDLFLVASNNAIYNNSIFSKMTS